MRTKLKYVGVSIKDLLDIYILFIRSVTEYFSVVFHSSLNQEQNNKLEKNLKTMSQLQQKATFRNYKKEG